MILFFNLELSVGNFAHSVIMEIMLAKEPERRKYWIAILKAHVKQTNSKVNCHQIS